MWCLNLLWTSVALAAFILGGATGGGCINAKNFERINGRKSRQDVEAILGPPGDYRSGPIDPEHTVYGFYFGISPSEVALWYSDTGIVEIHFFGTHIGRKYYTPTQQVPQPPLENLIWRANRQWHRWFPEK
jgi:hypothetical protein